MHEPAACCGVACKAELVVLLLCLKLQQRLSFHHVLHQLSPVLPQPYLVGQPFLRTALLDLAQPLDLPCVLGLPLLQPLVEVDDCVVSWVVVLLDDYFFSGVGRQLLKESRLAGLLHS